jgi:hypothetical protein
MNLSALILMSVAVPPAPSGTKDIAVAVYYSQQSEAAVSLVGSAASSLTVATWRLTDGTLCQSLAHAASSGRSVVVAYNGSAGTSDAQYIATRGIVASGGTVVACDFPRHIANNFVSADGVYTITGNYYYSPSAVQIGSYSVAISGTNAAAQSASTFQTLISSGTVTINFDRETDQYVTISDTCKQVYADYHHHRRFLAVYIDDLGVRCSAPAASTGAKSRRSCTSGGERSVARPRRPRSKRYGMLTGGRRLLMAHVLMKRSPLRGGLGRRRV